MWASAAWNPHFGTLAPKCPLVRLANPIHQSVVSLTQQSHVNLRLSPSLHFVKASLHIRRIINRGKELGSAIFVPGREGVPVEGLRIQHRRF